MSGLAKGCLTSRGSRAYSKKTKQNKKQEVIISISYICFFLLFFLSSIEPVHKVVSSLNKRVFVNGAGDIFRISFKHDLQLNVANLKHSPRPFHHWIHHLAAGVVKLFMNMLKQFHLCQFFDIVRIMIIKHFLQTGTISYRGPHVVFLAAKGK